MRLICVLGLGLLLCGNFSGQSRPAVSGEYVEARSGEVYTCGCLFSSEQVTAGQEAILAWDIREGEHNGSPLGGMKAAAVIVAQGNLGLAATTRRSVLYISSESTPDQREAVVDLLSHNYGQMLGEIIAVDAAPVSFYKDVGQTHVRVGDTLDLTVRATRLPEDAHPGSFLWYGPFISVKAPTLSTTLYYRYWGSDFARQWWTSDPGITAYTGEFALVR